jgi:hypothetical protein
MNKKAAKSAPKNKAKKQPKPPPQTDEDKKPRKLKPGKYKSFQLGKKKDEAKIKPVRRKVSPAYKLFWRALKLLGTHWKLFGGILLIYFILTVILVGGAANTGKLLDAKSNLHAVFGDSFHGLSTGVGLFGYLLIHNEATGQAGNVYQTVLLLIFSLVFIWTLRQVYAKPIPRIRDTFYNGIAPLAQFVLVLVVMALQLVPAAMATIFYTQFFAQGIAANIIEQILAGIIIFMLLFWTVYMLTSSVFALYLVTLPGMTPVKALRSAAELVRFRRGKILLKVIFLPITLLIILGLITIPLALYATIASSIVLFVLSIIVVAVVHSYMYGLYRELLS